MFLSLPKNTQGRDFFVGDIHGCFYLLSQALDYVGFDTTSDRLFSTGDLIDRGEFSEEVIHWLNQPYFYAIRGNHEQVLLDAVSGKCDEDYHRMMGGDWWYDLGLDRSTKKQIIRQLTQLPLMLEVPTKHGMIGLVHAEVWGSDWLRAKEIIELKPSVFYHKLCAISLWARERISHGDTSNVQHIDLVVAGHTPRTQPVVLGNVVYIDLGMGYHNEFHQGAPLFEASELFALLHHNQ